MEKEMQIRGRLISPDDLQFIRQLLASEGHKGRTHISRRLCRIWQWRQANGAYREIACRELLRKLEERDLISLPPQLKPARKPGYRNRASLPPNLDTTPLQGRLDHFPALTIELVSRTPKEKLYNGLIGAHHYLGYGQGTGEQLKYVACRDRFIGWDDHVRQNHLNLIVNNHRFLILPWVKVANLASWILAGVSRRLRQDWQARYAHDIVLVETFVEKNRFYGTCYRAANWICVGETVGRGRNDRFSQNWLPIKQVYLYPLAKNFRERCQSL